MSRKPISMFQPFISDLAINRVSEVLKGRWVGQGALVDRFEEELEMCLKIKNAVAVNCSSSAIRLALTITGIQPGDEIITTPLTCTLTNHPVLELYAKPVFADIQYDTGNIDPKDIEKRITPKTKAIICTHWGGTPSDLDEILNIARKHNLVVIEDASEAIGASYKDKPIGSISDFTAFSFQAIQIITTAEGGALISKDPQDAELARIHRWYGIDRKTRMPNEIGYFDFDIAVIGFGYHMTNLSAAIGLENLKLLDGMLKRRQFIANQYWENLKSIPGVKLLKRYTDRLSSNHFFTIRVENRNEFCRKMKEFGIDVSIVHYRNDAYSVFGGLCRDLPNLDKFSATYIALPIHMYLTDDDVNYIVETIKAGW